MSTTLPPIMPLFKSNGAGLDNLNAVVQQVNNLDYYLASAVVQNLGSYASMAALQAAYPAAANVGATANVNGVPAVSDGTAWRTMANWFRPVTADYAGITAAITMAKTAGGGIIVLDPITYNIGTNTIDLTGCSNIKIRGTSMSSNMASSNADPYSGTVIVSTSTTDPAIGFNYVDAANNSVNPYTAMIRGVEISNLRIDGGGYGIKIGSLYNGGIEDLFIQNVYSSNATLWGFWLENCHTSLVDGAVSYNHIGGGFAFGGSGTSWWQYGQNTIRRVITQAGARNAKGSWFFARGTGSSINDHKVYDCCNINPAVSLVTETVTLTAGSANIPVADISKYAVGNGVCFSGTLGTVTGIFTNPSLAYQVLTVTPNTGGATSGPGNITIAYTIGGTAITFGGSGTASVTLGGRGGTNILFGPDDSYGTTQGLTSFWATGLDTESCGTVAMYMVKTSASRVESAINGSLAAGNYSVSACIRQVGSDSFFTTLQRLQVFDYDSSGSFLTFNGPLPVTILNALGYGMQFDSALNASRLTLGDGSAVQGIRSGNGNLRPLNGFGTAFFLATAQTNQSTQYGAHTSCVVYTGASGSTYTLQTVTDDFTNGFVLIFFNSASGAVTIAGGGANIIGKGTSGSSISVAANTSVVLQLMKNGSTRFWAQHV